MDEAVEAKPQIKALSSVKNFVSGACGGISLVFAGHPLDTIKVRCVVYRQGSVQEKIIFRPKLIKKNILVFCLPWGQ